MGNQRSSLQKEEIEILANSTHYTRRELKQLYKQFLDEAPNGSITRKDFGNLTELMGITDPFMIDLVFNAFDQNKDGTIAFDEFIIAMSVMTRGATNEKLEFAFSLYDIDNDGFITKDEMTRIVVALYRMLGDLVTVQGEEFDSPEELVDRVFADMDTNRDGKLTLEEYISGATRNQCILQGLGVFETGNIK